MSQDQTTQNGSITTNGLINPTLLTFFLTFNLLICAVLVAMFGIVGNVINIVNFATQGLHDSVNVTLTALAVNDLVSLLFKLLVNVFWGYVDMPISPSISSLFIYPHCYFNRVSGYITAFAAFERCLCVVLPLKVKTIITRKVAIVVNCGIFVVLSLYLFPMYYVSYLDLKYSPETNRSVLSLFYRYNAESVLSVGFFINDLVLPYVSFLILIVSTAFIITVLKSKAKWRESVSVANISHSRSKVSGGAISSKEKKTTVMLTTVSVIFVAFMTPGCAIMTAVGFTRELKMEGSYFDLTMLVCSFTVLLETVNCSVNTVVYFTMSSKYRETIYVLFPHVRKNT